MSAFREIINGIFAVGVSIMGGSSLAQMLVIKNEEIQAINELWTALSIFGIGMILIHYLLDLNNTIANSGSNFTMQLFTMPTIKFCMACAICGAGGEITCKIVEFGNGMITTLADNSIQEEASTINVADDWGIFACLCGFVIGLCFWLVCIIIRFLFVYKSIAYKIELVFRVGLAPLFMGDLADGFHSGAVRYWKRILGTMLYGASFILVITIGTQVADSLAGNLIFPFDKWNGGVGGFVLEETNLLYQLCDALQSGLAYALVAVAELGVLGSIKQVCMEVGQ